jgi:hypothetical protein
MKYSFSFFMFFAFTAIISAQSSSYGAGYNNTSLAPQGNQYEQCYNRAVNITTASAQNNYSASVSAGNKIVRGNASYNRQGGTTTENWTECRPACGNVSKQSQNDRQQCGSDTYTRVKKN